jgi:hypothetical protein
LAAFGDGAESLQELSEIVRHRRAAGRDDSRTAEQTQQHTFLVRQNPWSDPDVSRRLRQIGKIEDGGMTPASPNLAIPKAIFEIHGTDFRPAL